MQAQEETIHLKEIIRLKDKEILNLTQLRVNRSEEAQLQSIARDRDKDMTINELRIHLVRAMVFSNSRLARSFLS